MYFEPFQPLGLVNTADTPSGGAYAPQTQARLLALFHADTGLLTQLVSAPLLTHDLALVQHVHPAFASEDVLVADRGLCS